LGVILTVAVLQAEGRISRVLRSVRFETTMAPPIRSGQVL